MAKLCYWQASYACSYQGFFLVCSSAQKVQLITQNIGKLRSIYPIFAKYEYFGRKQLHLYHQKCLKPAFYGPNVKYFSEDVQLSRNGVQL